MFARCCTSRDGHVDVSLWVRDRKVLAIQFQQASSRNDVTIPVCNPPPAVWSLSLVCKLCIQHKSPAYCQSAVSRVLSLVTVTTVPVCCMREVICYGLLRHTIREKHASYHAPLALPDIHPPAVTVLPSMVAHHQPPPASRNKQLASRALHRTAQHSARVNARWLQR